MSSDWDLMQIHMSALFRHDERNRLLAVNEPGPPWRDDPLPPRLYLGRTREGLTWRFRHDLPESLVAELEPMLAAEPVAADLSRPPRCLAALQSTLARYGPITGTWSGPAWHFPDEIPTFEYEAIPVATANDELVRLLSRSSPRTTCRGDCPAWRSWTMAVWLRSASVRATPLLPLRPGWIRSRSFADEATHRPSLLPGLVLFARKGASRSTAPRGTTWPRDRSRASSASSCTARTSLLSDA